MQDSGKGIAVERFVLLREMKQGEKRKEILPSHGGGWAVQNMLRNWKKGIIVMLSVALSMDGS